MDEPHPAPTKADYSGTAVLSRGPFRPDRKLSKEEINRLELQAYRGPIQVIRSQQGMFDAVKVLKRERVLGFDTETRPTFRKGQSYPPAILQLAGSRGVYIFQLRYLGLHRALTEILGDPKIVKAGVAIGRDVKDLRKLSDFEPQGFVDLGVHAKAHGLQHHGLRGLSALLLGCRISKSARLTNWSRSQLSSAAQRYAATDAWIGRRLYKTMKKWGYV